MRLNLAIVLVFQLDSETWMSLLFKGWFSVNFIKCLWGFSAFQ